MNMIEFRNYSIEQAVLAALMTIEDSYEQLPEHFDAEVFDVQGHKVIFDAIAALVKAKSKHDAVIVNDYLIQHQLHESSGGEKYLMQLLADSPASLYNLPQYCEILMTLRDKRIAALELQQGIATLKTNADKTASEVIAQVASQLSKIGTSESDAPKDTEATAKELLDGLVNNDFAGTPTGYVELDNKIVGLAPGQVIIIAGRPAMGKSVMAGNLVDELEQKTGKPALVFSMEMAAREWTARIISNHSNVPYQCFKSSQIEDDDVPKVKAALNHWKTRKIFIKDRKSMTVEQMAIICQKFKREHGELACIAVDYLQLLQVGKKSGNRTTDVDDMSRAMKILAGEMNCPVIVLSQLNRSLEQRPNKRPIMSDLRESGAIEQDADLILFIYRDEVYNKDSQFKGIAEIIIGKQRSGELATIPLVFNGAFARFENPRYGIDLEQQEQAA